ncbi:MAG TPA: membrane protein insertion efficiency factor YidD [Actinomycetota bacterium]|nr:membrane protein insertion efficiency factor YidD [Actinomycetota bacterium]
MNVLRRAAWTVGAPFRGVLVAGIRLYRVTLSGWLGGQCRFYPTCSRYAEDAVRARGAIAGTVLATWRVLRCNPFGAGGLDPAPDPRSYDDVIPQDVTPGAVIHEGAPRPDEVPA